jgi:hypothetical protein
MDNARYLERDVLQIFLVTFRVTSFFIPSTIVFKKYGGGITSKASKTLSNFITFPFRLFFY